MKLQTWIVCGPPGAGKTTALNQIAAELPLCRFKVREHAERVAARGGPRGRTLRRTLDAYAVFEDCEVKDLFRDFMAASAATAGVVSIEGYPKSIAQVADLEKVLERMGLGLSGTCHITVSDHVSETRTRWRLVCARCGEVTAGADTLAHCGEPMKRREDDADSRRSDRLNHYRETMRPVLLRLRQMADFVEIDGAGTTASTADALHAVLAGSARPETVAKDG